MRAWLNKWLRGAEGAPPFLVRLTRGTLEVAALAGLAFVFDNAVNLSPDEWKVVVGAFLPAVTFIEGIADQVLDPTQNRAPER